ncbi:formyltetrahydrofolate deformylase [Komagataeibacter sp. FNDCF1]|uniref:formyltetrahydrofolate deformylase n=1 Tax=Komagataeibacter sp. FNDCF1 TaxID=2878681 RepID=UPI001E570067|nr:formyltetrahydrofolate deformylase [Komagataeibacter sp. FNDCF1]MCE2564547.1 formyltetrahydrofolate deformylase [Komagataeibacter sp. FNDCF1]
MLPPDKACGWVVVVSCKSVPGIVSEFSRVLFEAGGNIIEMNQYNDLQDDQFFMRVYFTYARDAGTDALREKLAQTAARFDARWSLRNTATRQKVLIMVSRFDHCLADLLYRWRIGELNMDPVAIVSNHPREACDRVDTGSIPFYHLAVTPQTKASQETRLRQIIRETGAELVVLARYMQILSDELSHELEGRCINIHHSFLPGFKGARPYHQAHRRGVKLIGATAHYVTAELDEGPIIEQSVERINHSNTAEDLIRKGRDIESRALSRAVHYHLEGRVILHGIRTVVFAD